MIALTFDLITNMQEQLSRDLTNSHDADEAYVWNAALQKVYEYFEDMIMED